MSTDKRPSSVDKNFVKIIVVGDGGVGKTCMLMVYNNNKFPTGYVPTVFENYAVNMTIDDKPYTISLFDTAGQEGFDRLRPLAYPGTDVFLVCYSVDSETSCNNVVHKWLPEVRHYCKDTPILIVGTKTDVRNNSSKSSISTKEQGVKLATQEKVHKYLECSALKNENVKRVFDEAIYLSIENKKDNKRIDKTKKENCGLM